MDVFYLSIGNFTENIDTCELDYFKKKELGSKKRMLEHSISMFLLEFVLSNFYKIKEFEICYENKKPKLKNDEIYFSVSHSNDIVLIGFNNCSIGVDIEEKKERNFEKLSDYYGITCNDKESFYEFWTRLEAEIKLQKPVIDIITRDFTKDCKLSIASVDIIEKLNLYEIRAIKKISLKEVMKNPKNSIIIVKKNI